MQEFVILGNSPAGYACLQALRREGFPGRVVIVPGDGEYPYWRSALPDVLAKTVPVEKAYCAPAASYEPLNVQVCSKKIGRVNFRRQRITTEEKDVIPFDYCLIDEPGWLPPEDMKGASRNGFLLMNRLDHIKTALKQLLYADTVLVQGGSLNGIRMAGALSVWDKEVLWVCSEERLLGAFVEPEISARITEELAKKGVRVLLENSIVEVLGDSEVKAVRLKSGKILAAQMVLAESHTPDCRLFKDTELFSGGMFLPPGENGATAYPNVFMTGRGTGLLSAGSASYNSCDDILQEQGTAVASQILQKNMPLKPVVPQADVTWPGFQLTLLGCTSPKGVQEAEVYRRSDEATGSAQWFYVRDGMLTGAVLINADLSRYQALSLLSSLKPLSEEYLKNQGFQMEHRTGHLTDSALPENTGYPECAQPYENVQNS